MKNFKKPTMMLLVLLSLALLLSACAGTTPPADNGPSAAPAQSAAPAPSAAQTEAPAPTAEEAKVEGETELVIAIPSDLFRTDPTWDSNGSSRNVYINTFERILAFDEDYNLIPALASKYERIDETTWEFTLRDGAKFWDGSSVTAKDVKATIERAANDTTSRLNSYVASVEAVEVLSDTQFRIKTNKIDAILPNRMANIFVVSEASLADYDAGTAVSPMGSGPYKIVAWNQNEQLVAELNEHYTLAKPEIDRLVYRVITEPATRIAELQAGTVHLISGLTPDMVGLLENNDNVSVKSVKSNRTMFIAFNTWGDGPLSDKRVRQAINYAVDMDAIIEGLFLGYGEVSSQVVNNNAFGYNPNVTPYPYDPAKAKALLAEAGYPDGFEVNFNSPTGRYVLDKDIAEIVTAQLAEVGIKVNLELEEYNSFWARCLAVEFDGMFQMSIGNYYADPDFVMDLWLYSGARGLYYNTPETDALIEAAKTSLDQAEREQIYFQLMELLHEDAPWLFTVENEDIYAVNTKVRGWAPRSDELMYFENAYFIQ